MDPGVYPMDGDRTAPDRQPGSGGRPLFQVISGSATAEEVAAVLAVLAAARAASADPQPGVQPDPQPGPGPGTGSPEASTWTDRGLARRGERSALTPSAHGWRTSYWPR